jgi:ABC-type polysaccharide/polyol phosphate export permease
VAVVTGVVVDRTRHYKRVLLGAIIAALGAQLWLIFAMVPNNHVSLALAMGAVGLSALSLTPVCLELSVEVRPLPPLWLVLVSKTLFLSATVYVPRARVV